jgi:hypothetical protein
VWRGGRHYRRRHRGRYGQAANAARIDADFTAVFVGNGYRPLRAAAVANNAIRLIDGFGRSPRGDETRYQACKCNRIGGGEHSDAPL